MWTHARRRCYCLCENCTHTSEHIPRTCRVCGCLAGDPQPPKPPRGRTQAPAHFCRRPSYSHNTDHGTGLPHGRESLAPGPEAEHRRKAELTPTWAQVSAPQNMQHPSLGWSLGTEFRQQRLAFHDLILLLATELLKQSQQTNFRWPPERWLELP